MEIRPARLGSSFIMICLPVHMYIKIYKAIFRVKLARITYPIISGKGDVTPSES